MIDGVALNELPSARRDRFRGANVGFVFQELNLIPGLTAVQNVLLAPFAAGVPQDRSRARDLLSRLGVGPAAALPAEELSRGQAQRVAIARAMLLRPKLILADEPTSSLDAANCHIVASLLREAAVESNAALVIVTHDERLKALFPGQTIVEPVV
jgi:ABC-type lipoprotein export system ATPase subunit